MTMSLKVILLAYRRPYAAHYKSLTSARCEDGLRKHCMQNATYCLPSLIRQVQSVSCLMQRGGYSDLIKQVRMRPDISAKTFWSYASGTCFSPLPRLKLRGNVISKLRKTPSPSNTKASGLRVTVEFALCFVLLVS